MAERGSKKTLAAQGEYESTAHVNPRSTDRSISLMESRDAKVKKSSPTDDEILKESLHVQSNPKTCVTTATTQLKVLCRKFAVLSDKVKQEAKMREDAEKEIKRLNDVIEAAKDPVISSTRSDAQYVGALKTEVAHLKGELSRTKDELFHTKHELESLRSHTTNAYSFQNQHHPPPPVDPHSQWDREQTARIQETLSCTISELHDELSVKEVEIESLRVAVQREKAKQKDMEHMVASFESQNQEDKELLSKMTQDLRNVTMSQASEIEKLHMAQESVKEERSIKEALQHQISTLHQVNDALQKRCDALVRRLKLSANFAHESQSLKSQVDELETQNEGLVKSMRDLKQGHFQELEALKVALHSAQTTAQEAEKRVLELQGELTAMRIQNNTMSEYMMYGPKRVQPVESRETPSMFSQPHSPLNSPAYRPRQEPTSHYSQLQYNRQPHHNIQNMEGLRPPALPIQPPTHASHYNYQQQMPRNQEFTPMAQYQQPKELEHSVRTQAMTNDPSAPYYPPGSPEPKVRTTYSKVSTWRYDDKYIPETHTHTHEPENEQPTKRSSAGLNRSTSGDSDHSILRALKNRNKQLQERLQMEADATFQLEEEINMITSSYHTLLQNE
ncbi:Aste57867_17064 [Aphanomyces stellatus]|uniref:Aste57867_17064 protein n=1 Tax=Aphanomyces stellatus TaxID=120398 RepID=A0A485L6X3_9STRA|nr:hypothetical protein As57867_017006 [Aphanomyces stellatus]VFT93825.1 Aste57867_17064 [Aphanomyces stellatus]